MDKSPPDAPERLDSWKAIAAYLVRDERTVQRWERELGLPIRRVPGGRGRSVFAYPVELDAWLKSRQTEAEPEPAAAATTMPSSDRTVPRAGWRYGVAASVLIIAALAWRLTSATASPKDLRIEATPLGVVALAADGATRWRYPFPAAYTTRLAEDMGTPARMTAGDPLAIYVATASRERRADGVMEGGALTELDVNGREARSFSFTDTVTFGDTTYAPPWVVTTYAVDETNGVRRVAIAAHHAVWHASLVTVLDGQMRRLGTFAHAGWIEQLQWLAPDRLLIAGFSNAHDGGMAALLDPTARGGVNGQGPEPPGSPYYCQSCPAGVPVRMIVMPRTELNRMTAARFNRARIQVTLGRIFVRTIEVVPPAPNPAVDALYEFTPELDLIRASFSDDYRALYRALDAQGKLPHHRVSIADQDGPAEIQVWEPASGWRTQRTR